MTRQGKRQPLTSVPVAQLKNDEYFAKMDFLN